MKRSRSGQCGCLGSNLRNCVKRTVATSAMPIGMPGWPELAFSTASMDRARMALAISRSDTSECADFWAVAAAILGPKSCESGPHHAALVFHGQQQKPRRVPILWTLRESKHLAHSIDVLRDRGFNFPKGGWAIASSPLSLPDRDMTRGRHPMSQLDLAINRL